jgi:hypothetical protein
MPVRVDIKGDQGGDNPVKEAVAITATSVGQQPAMLSNMAYANTVANTHLAATNTVALQQALNQLSIAVTGKTVQSVQRLRSLEAASVVEVLTGDDTAEALADLKAADGGGSGPTPPLPPPGLVLPANPQGPPYDAEAPTQVTILNVADVTALQIAERSSNGGTIVGFTAPTYDQQATAKPTPAAQIPKPLPQAFSAYAPLMLAYTYPVRVEIHKTGVRITPKAGATTQ